MAIMLSASPLLGYVARLANEGDLVDVLPMPIIVNNGENPDDPDVRDKYTTRVSERIGRWTKQGKVEFFAADSFCIDYLGVHPYLVFGPDWFEVDDPACPILFRTPALDEAVA